MRYDYDDCSCYNGRKGKRRECEAEIVVEIMVKRQVNTNETIEHTKEGGDRMPTIEQVNYEMTAYLRDIEEYIERFKSLPDQEAKKQAKENLMDIGLIDEQGNLTDFYKNS